MGAVAVGPSGLAAPAAVGVPAVAGPPGGAAVVAAPAVVAVPAETAPPGRTPVVPGEGPAVPVLPGDGPAAPRATRASRAVDRWASRTAVTTATAPAPWISVSPSRRKRNPRMVAASGLAKPRSDTVRAGSRSIPRNQTAYASSAPTRLR